MDAHTGRQGGVVLTLDQLEAALRGARAAGETVVMCHGCFDLLHRGHIRHLEFAASLGDRLIVTITADAAMRKGPGRPLIPERDRANILAALACVDCVAIDPNPTAAENLQRLRPDIYVKGREYEHSRHPGFLAEKKVVEAYGGRVVFSPGDVVFSTTSLIDALRRGGDVAEDAAPGPVAPPWRPRVPGA
jgi:rfaE bifunctional protein nucleotidyltransferase chain/domain